MAIYKAFSPDVEVNGGTIASLIESLDSLSSFVQAILVRHGIVDPADGMWFNQQSWLSALQEIEEKLGEGAIYAIGKSVPKSALFPPTVNDLESAIKNIDKAFHLNHRNGEIGHYLIEEFNDFDAVMCCTNSYPCDFDRGIITTIAREFNPSQTLTVKVEQDDSKESRKKGGERSYYRITW